jgi:hypothetical protein
MITGGRNSDLTPDTTITYIPMPILGSGTATDTPVATVSESKNDQNKYEEKLITSLPISSAFQNSPLINIPISDLVIAPTIDSELDADELEDAIVAAFNQDTYGNEEYVSPTKPFEKGEKLEPHQFQLVRQNGKPLLITSRHKLLVPKNNMKIESKAKDKEIFKLSDMSFGTSSTRVIVIEPGKYGLVYRNNTYEIYDSGIHVIKGLDIRYEQDTHKVSKSKHYIAHGNIHILTLPPEKIARITLDNQNYFFEGTSQPHVFISDNFKFDEKIDFLPADHTVLSHGKIFRFAPDVDQIILITSNGNRIFYSPDPTDRTPRFFNEPLDAFGMISTASQSRAFPAIPKGEHSLEQEFKKITLSESSALGIQLHITYQVVDAPKIFADIYELEEVLDNQVANYVETLCLHALQGCVQNHFNIDKFNDEVSTSDITAIEKAFNSESIPSLEKKGIKVTLQLLNAQLFKTTKAAVRDTVVVTNDAQVMHSNNPNILFATANKEKDKEAAPEKDADKTVKKKDKDSASPPKP